LEQKAIDSNKTACERHSYVTDLPAGELIGTSFCTSEKYESGEELLVQNKGKVIEVNQFFECHAVCLREIPVSK